MAKYDFDSYMLYEIKKRNVYSCKIRVILKEKVNGAVLKEAAPKAFKRFSYYNRTVSVNAEGAYILEDCDKPIVVIEGDRIVRLGTEETNGLLFAICYENEDIFFVFSHNFCGGCGAMFWVKSTLWQYLTDLGYEVDKTGILTADTPITPEEMAEPDVTQLPEGEPLGKMDLSMDSFTPRSDYMEISKDPVGSMGYYPVIIPKMALMKYARDNDGSPNSIIAAALFKMYTKAFPNETKFTGQITNNYRADVGCPDTYKDIVRQMYVQYDAGKMKDWSIEKLSTVTRSRMYIQMQPEVSWAQFKRVEAFRGLIDEQPDLESKADYAVNNSLTTHGIPSSFVISYVGKIFWSGLGPYISGVYSITFGHVMLEVNATDEDFCISFQTIRRDDKYLKEFLEVLDEEGITYRVLDRKLRYLPTIELPPFTEG